MNRKNLSPPRLPPRLSMDEYVEFIDRSIREANPEWIARQKALEKQIRKPFDYFRGTRK